MIENWNLLERLYRFFLQINESWKVYHRQFENKFNEWYNRCCKTNNPVIKKFFSEKQFYQLPSVFNLGGLITCNARDDGKSNDKWKNFKLKYWYYRATRKFNSFEKFDALCTFSRYLGPTIISFCNRFLDFNIPFENPIKIFFQYLLVSRTPQMSSKSLQYLTLYCTYS